MRRELDLDRSAAVGRAEALDQGGDEVMVALGDDLAPGATGGLGLVDPHDPLYGPQDEGDATVRLDLEQEIGAGEGKPEKAGGIVGHDGLWLGCRL